MSILKKKTGLALSLLVILVVVIAFIISAKSPEPANPGDVKLTYKSNAGDVYYYESSRENTRTMEREGGSADFTTEREYDFQLKTEETEDGLSFILTVENLEISSKGGRGFGGGGLDGDKVKGKRVRIELSALGENKGITAIDSISFGRSSRRSSGRRPGGMRNPLNQLQIAFFTLPDKAIKVGDSWTEDYKEPADAARGFGSRPSMERKVEGKTTYTVVAEKKKMGLKCFYIKTESEYSRESYGTMRGSEVSSEGNGESSAEVWFAYEQGILVEYRQKDFYEGTTAFSGEMNRTMASANESKSTLKLVKWVPVDK